MHDSVHPKQAPRLTRACALALAVLLSGVLMASCGGGSGSPTAATSGGANASAPSTSEASAATTSRSSSVTSGPSAGASTTASSAGPPNALAFAKCMRADGVSNFPDPQPDGGGFNFHASAAVISSPAFKAAQAKCHTLLPGPLGSAAGSFSPQEQAQALAQLRSVAQCMRRHGIADFPDPTLTRPNPGLGRYTEITNYEGVWIAFPATIDLQSPAWERAAAACGPLAEGFTHPHH